jgi:hypothetical protein
VIHDYIFAVHRCHWNDPAVADITFEQSALVLAEVGKSLVDLHLIKHDALDAIVWGVKTQYARTLWDAPPNPTDCTPPKNIVPGVPVAHYDISLIRRRLQRAPGAK